MDSSLGIFCDMIKDIVSEKNKADRLSRYDEQDDFRRSKTKAKKAEEAVI